MPILEHLRLTARNEVRMFGKRSIFLSHWIPIALRMPKSVEAFSTRVYTSFVILEGMLTLVKNQKKNKLRLVAMHFLFIILCGLGNVSQFVSNCETSA